MSHREKSTVRTESVSLVFENGELTSDPPDSLCLVPPPRAGWARVSRAKDAMPSAIHAACSTRTIDEFDSRLNCGGHDSMYITQRQAQSVVGGEATSVVRCGKLSSWAR